MDTFFKGTVFNRLPLKFIEKWVPLQFKAWKRSKQVDVVVREHEDANKEFEALPDNVKNFLMLLVPQQLELLLRQGEDELRCMRLAASTGDRKPLESQLSCLAESYHDIWYVARQLQLTFLTEKPKVRPDDVPWSDLGESFQIECLEIIWQFCILLHELDDADFEQLIRASK